MTEMSEIKFPLRTNIRRHLLSDRDATISIISDWAKRAKLPIYFHLLSNMNDDRLVEIAVEAWRKNRRSPEVLRTRGYRGVRTALKVLSRANKVFKDAGATVGGLNDARAILNRVMQDAPKEDDD